MQEAASKEQKVKKITLSDGRVVMMRKPKVFDMRAVKEMGLKDAFEEEIEMIANLTGLTREEIDGLDLDDYMKLQKEFVELGGFLK